MSSRCQIEEISTEASGHSTARLRGSARRPHAELASAQIADTELLMRHVCWLLRYEAELNAEVQRLKMGDKDTAASSDVAAASASRSDATAAAASSPASAAAASSSPAAAVESANAATTSADAAPATAVGSEARSSAEILTEQILPKDLSKALEAKARGNQFFARQAYEEAIAEYSLAIRLCPASAVPSASPVAAAAADAAGGAADDSIAQDDQATPEAREHLSVFFSNRAAAYLMAHRFEETVADCTASLSLHAGNPKALSRRARAHEALEQYPEAIEDLKALVALDPLDRDCARNLARVETLHKEKTAKMTAEMMDKLKGFGNTILGKFGMSLDNFKATQDPATGSYNISFGK